MKTGASIFGAGRFAGVAHMPGRKATATPAPASANPPSASQRKLLAMVHMAKKDLGLAEDDYREILLDVTGHRSAGDCDLAQLGKIIDRFRARGWKQAQPKGRTGARRADHPSARKARAMWISLHALGAIDDPSEAALEAFAKRQLGCTTLQWADQGQAFKLIEALKKMAEREGWDQSLAGVKAHARVTVLKRRLAQAILAKLIALGEVPADWSFERAALAFTGAEINLLTATDSELDIVARELGNALRQIKGPQ